MRQPDCVLFATVADFTWNELDAQRIVHLLQHPGVMFERLDFASFHSANAVERDEICRKLVSGLKQNGFVRLVNHGVPPSDIDKAFETVTISTSTAVTY